jgi:CubicO group peptidase (beta-lactamase class C family)
MDMRAKNYFDIQPGKVGVAKTIVLLLTISLVAGGSLTPRLCAQVATNRYERELQPLIQKFIQKQQVPGLAIAILKNNRIVYAHAFGVQNISKTNEPMTTHSLFHIASITKPFVATSIMQLVEQRKIDLDAPVVKYLPYFHLADERYSTITIRQMITHTSGMPDVEDYEWNKPQYDDAALERYVRSLGDLKLLFSPGQDFRYSNIAFEILGDVVAKVSGESFEDYVQRHILTPLGMGSSTLLVKEADPRLLTWGHWLDEDGNPEPSKDFPYNRIHTPSSNLLSNVLDMSLWAMANLNRGELDGKRILQNSTYDEMWKPAHKAMESYSMGISWFLTKYRGHRLVSHDGSDLGFEADLEMLPEQRIAVVWMTNCDWVNTTLSRAAFDVALGYKPRPIELPRSVGAAMYAILQEQGTGSVGVEAAIAEYLKLKEKKPLLYDFSEAELSSIADYMLEKNHVEGAIRFLQFNVQQFPSSGPAFDRLANAYAISGDGALAISNYEKALKLNPKLAHAREELAKLKSKRK